MKLIKVLILGMFFIFASNSVANGCVCVGADNAKDALKNWSDTVFSGEVISNEKLKTDSSQIAVLTFRVERVWKGVTTGEIVVRDYNAGSSCAAADFKVGERYIVFANSKNEQGRPFTDDRNELYISIDACSRTTNLSNPKVEKKIFDKIGKGKPIKRTISEPARDVSASLFYYFYVF